MKESRKSYPFAQIVSTSLLFAITLALSACVATDSPQTLTQSKSQVQLLRDEVTARLPEGIIQFATNSDSSIACDDDESIRSWHSTAMIEIDPFGGVDLDSVVDELSASFEKDGWLAGPGNSRVVTKQAYFADGIEGVQIQITVLPHEERSDEIFINVFGPCVQTEGLTSQEVITLERESAA